MDHVKMVRARPDLRFEHRIHEQIIPAIHRAGGRVAWTDIFVTHSGSDRSEDGQQRKLGRDLRILHQELAERPDHPFVLFNLGMTYAHARRYGEAVSYLRRCLAVSRPQESHVRKAYALLAGAHVQAGDEPEAWRVCREGLDLFPTDKELLFRAGALHHHFGRLDEAAQAYRAALRPQGERRFESIVCGIDGYKARHNLALVYEDMDRLDEAEAQWRQVVRERPSYRLGWRGLGAVLLRRGDHQAAARVADDLCADASLRVEGLVLDGQLAEARGDFAEARRKLEWAAAARGDEDLFPLRELCRFLFERVDPAEAGDVVKTLARQEPDNPSAHANLGAYHHRVGDFAAAAASYLRSLELRPDSVATRVQLAQVLESAGKPEAARDHWRAVLERQPDHAQAAAAMENSGR